MSKFIVMHGFRDGQKVLVQTSKVETVEQNLPDSENGYERELTVIGFGEGKLGMGVRETIDEVIALLIDAGEEVYAKEEPREKDQD